MGTGSVAPSKMVLTNRATATVPVPFSRPFSRLRSPLALWERGGGEGALTLTLSQRERGRCFRPESHQSFVSRCDFSLSSLTDSLTTLAGKA